MQTVQALLDLHGAHWTTTEPVSGMLLLNHAAAYGATATVAVLLEAKADLRGQWGRRTPLGEAVRNGHAGTVAVLLDWRGLVL